MRTPIFAAALIFSFCAPHPVAGRAEKGVIRVPDLGGYNTVNLDGEWDFYRGKHLTPGEISGLTPATIAVPGVWNTPAQKPLPGYGIGTYHLKIILTSAPSAENFSLLLPAISTSYRLFVNGNLMTAKGGLCVRGTRTNNPLYISKNLRGGRRTLHRRGSFSRYGVGGVLDSNALCSCGTKQLLPRLQHHLCVNQH